MSRKVVLTGNDAAAEAAALCRPGLVAAYPITPQSKVVEHLADMIYDGRLDSEMIQVESEHSAMSAVQARLPEGDGLYGDERPRAGLMFEPICGRLRCACPWSWPWQRGK